MLKRVTNEIQTLKGKGRGKKGYYILNNKIQKKKAIFCKKKKKKLITIKFYLIFKEKIRIQK